MAYFSNNSEGKKLQRQCEKCPIGDGTCPVYLVQAIHNYDQIGNDKLKHAMEILVSKDGICQVRKELLKFIKPKQEKH